MNEFEFDRLMELHQRGVLTGEKKALVEAWLDSTGPGGETDFAEADQAKLKQKIFYEIRESSVSGNTLSSGRNSAVGSQGLVYKIAASVMLAVAIGYAAWQYTVRTPATLQASSSGSIQKVILADGTLVWLKGKSKLTYPPDLSGETREVALEGEALFEVAKDARRPFIIHAGNFVTTVLGTSFNIRSDQQQFELMVLTGKVSLTSVHDEQDIMVLPNEKVVYGCQQGMSKTAAADIEKIATIKDTEYAMAFEDTRMDEVARRLEKKFDVRISMADARLAGCRITADLTDQSLEKTLNMLSQAVGFEYNIDTHNVVLKGKGCD